MITWFGLGRAGVDVNTAVGGGLAATGMVRVATPVAPSESVTCNRTVLLPAVVNAVVGVGSERVVELAVVVEVPRVAAVGQREVVG